MIIESRYGAIEGIAHQGCMAYLGIPFARPPIADLSFKHPLPPEPWEGILKADKGSPNPIQGSGGFSLGNNSQDCLYLNVFVPEHSQKPLPVMVWIYGGSYTHGGAGAKEKNTTDLQYDLAYFAKDSGCIVVTFNYRLNLYGFLNLHSMDPDFDQNNGLYDQIMALRFVKENIAVFGGDADNVTVFGQSAGGACILALMCMKEAEGLFHKAIIQSACIEHFFQEEESKKLTLAYMKIAKVKCPKELFHLSEEAICNANKKFESWVLKKGDIRCAFSPIIDGKTLPDEPKQAVKKSGLPILIGNVMQEGNLFVRKIPGVALPFVSRYFHMNLEKNAGHYRQRMSDALTRHIYVRPMIEILDDYQGPAWRYEYQFVSPESKMGCYHTCELPVMFGLGQMKKTKDVETERVGKEMRQIWGRFAQQGNPGWEKYRDDPRPFLIR